MSRFFQGARLRRWGRRIGLFVGGLLVVATAFRVVPHRRLASRTTSSTAVYDRHHHLLRLTLAEDEQYRLWTPLDRISPLLVEATLLYEDQHYYQHFAVNPVSLGRAFFTTYFGGARRVGGSTIPMQLARRLYGMPSRTAWGKLAQIARATQLELMYSKKEILEAYLNLVPYGGNIEGVGAASLIYFGKTADKLLLSEALALAVIPKSPSRRAPDGKPNAALVTARAALFEKWLERHPEGRKEEALLHLPLTMRQTEDLPFLAPHLTDAVLADKRGGTEPGAVEIDTTLDLSLQRLVERHARSYVARQTRVGIRNAVVMLADYRTMEVRALLGSVDFKSDAIAGQVNGTLAKRSPGSALKPFVYALGIEEGIIHPQSILKDAPVSYSTYSPENFDGRYVGPISAQDALVRSRNIPALSVAAKLNQPSFYDFLRTAGVSKLQLESHYGLSLVLGGAEVSMEELVTLYAALANRGVLRPLRYRKGDPNLATTDGTRILGEASSYVTLDMLSHNPRPDRGRIAGWDPTALPVYWKTGTSYGFRDAWAVGIFGPYVLAVWIGNFGGEGNPAFVGVQAAAPLFFQIVDSVVADDRGLSEPAFPAPGNLTHVEVCAISGQLPGPHCTRKRSTWFIPGRSPIDGCQIHRFVEVDDASGKQVCPPYPGKHHGEVFEYWSSDMLKLFALAGLPRRSPPVADASCPDAMGASRGMAPRITSPIAGVHYQLRGRADAPESIAFQAVSDADAREVHWFVDEKYVGKAKGGAALLWTPVVGSFVVRAVDDQGRSDARELRVERAQ